MSGKLADVNKQNLSELVSFKNESVGQLTTYNHTQICTFGAFVHTLGVNTQLYTCLASPPPHVHCTCIFSQVSTLFWNVEQDRKAFLQSSVVVKHR